MNTTIPRPLRRRSLLFALMLGLVQFPSAAQVSNSFDTGLEGWQPVFFGVSWENSGGNPGGFIRFEETGIPPFTSLVAPASYLGSWSSLDGVGSFRYDFRHFSGGSDPTTAGLGVFGGGGSMFWHQPAGAGMNGWETLIAPLTESNWQIISGSWDDILANVTEVRLFPDYLDAFGETTGIDNVALVPEPALGLAITLGAVLILLWSKKRWAADTERASR